MLPRAVTRVGLLATFDSPSKQPNTGNQTYMYVGLLVLTNIILRLYLYLEVQAKLQHAK